MFRAGAVSKRQGEPIRPRKPCLCISLMRFKTCKQRTRKICGQEMEHEHGAESQLRCLREVHMLG